MLTVLYRNTLGGKKWGNQCMHEVPVCTTKRCNINGDKGLFRFNHHWYLNLCKQWLKSDMRTWTTSMQWIKKSCLISHILVACTGSSYIDWCFWLGLAFLHPGCFCIAHHLFCGLYLYIMLSTNCKCIYVATYVSSYMHMM